jgi:hypothetical protein
MTTNEDTPLLGGCDAVAAADVAARYVAAVVTAPGVAEGSFCRSLQDRSAAAAAAAAAAGSDSALKQLLALAVTSVKCGIWIGKLTPVAFSDAVAVLHAVVALCTQVLGALNPGCGFELDNDSRGATYRGSSSAAVATVVSADATVIAPWVAVIARVAFAVAELLQQALPLLQ